MVTLARLGHSIVQPEYGRKLVGAGYVGTPLQGVSVDISADASTIAVGGFNDNGGTGAVWMWDNGRIKNSPSLQYTQVGYKLFGTVIIRQGFSVALSAKGTRLAVGGVDPVYNCASVIIWQRYQNLWSMNGYPISFPTYLPLSIAVNALSDDGNTLAVGSEPFSTANGAVAILAYRDNEFVLENVLQGSVTNDNFGFAVALSSNGSTVSVASNNQTGGSPTNQGWIYV
jgi:hypothetical protein